MKHSVLSSIAFWFKNAALLGEEYWRVSSHLACGGLQIVFYVSRETMNLISSYSSSFLVL